MNPSDKSKQSEAGNLLLHLLISLALVVIIVLIGWRVYELHKNKTVPQTVLTTSTTTPTTTPSKSSSTTPTVAAGTDNTTLSNDLNNVNGLLSAQSSDSAAVQSALNDSQNEITVPTN